MSKSCNFPILYENLLTLQVCKFKEWEYFLPNQIKTGIIKWLSNDIVTNSISVFCDMTSKRPYLKISYHYNNEHFTQNIDLVSKTSNLGVGTVWYFYCPITQQLCRKLYFSNGKFTHRSAITGFYEIQIKSKKERLFNIVLQYVYSTDKLNEQMYSKYFKKYYRGKITKKYKSILEKLDRSDKDLRLMYKLLK